MKPKLQDAILITAQFLVAWMASARRTLTYFDAYDPRWQRTVGYLTDVSVADDGSVWGVGRWYPTGESNVFRWSDVSIWRLLVAQQVVARAGWSLAASGPE